MMTYTFNELSSLLQLSPLSVTGHIAGISIDTRNLQPGSLFIALKGEKTDGHLFLEAAKEKGASAALVNYPVKECTLPQFIVPNTETALTQLSAHWRNQFDLPVIAVTGSNGKTTVKNMIASILRAAVEYPADEVLATLGTLNNHLGLPLTLAQLSKQHRYAVFELGMNHFGEINHLTHLAKPTVALITNAAESHLAGLGNVAGVAKAKAEIFNGLNANGIAVLNHDDVFFDEWKETVASKRIVTFGLHAKAAIRSNVRNEASQTFTLETPTGNIEITCPLLGTHNQLNALAAAAACYALEIPLTAIKAGIEAITPAPGRMVKRALNHGVTLIDDTYNANPFSLKAAINTLKSFNGDKIVVLGDMKELGQNEVTLHFEAGQFIREAGIEQLFTYGQLSEHTARGFGEGAKHFTDQTDLTRALKPLLSNTTVLVKGSRSMKMENIISQIQ